MAAIIDCTTFFNENDVLSIRLEELYPVVDKFVIVQANHTFRGKSKPDYFDYDMHAPYMDKIKLVTIEEFPPARDAWDRERYQRDFTASVLWPIAADSLVIIADVDEIPRRSVLENLDYTGPVRLDLKKFSYSLNCLTIEKQQAVKITTAEQVILNGFEWERRNGDFTLIEGAGWEFSSFGTPEMVALKLQSFSHDELDDPEFTDLDKIQSRMVSLQDVAGREFSHTVVPVDNTWPEAVKNNLNRWKDYIW